MLESVGIHFGGGSDTPVSRWPQKRPLVEALPEPGSPGVEDQHQHRELLRLHHSHLDFIAVKYNGGRAGAGEGFSFGPLKGPHPAARGTGWCSVGHLLRRLVNPPPSIT